MASKRVSILQDLWGLFNRLVKMCESGSVVDITGRQRVTLDSITSGTQLGIAIAASSAAVPGTNYPTAYSPTTTGPAYWQPVWTGPVDQRFQIIDQARTAYAVGIRANITFS
jgi:hypothetical protein